MTKNNLFIYLVLSILLLSCNSNKYKNSGTVSPEKEEFTYRFSMESVGNYKVDFQLNHDSTYQIEQQNYFFDRHSGTNTSTSKQGVLTFDEFSRFNNLVIGSDLYSLDDSYGFYEFSDNSIIYIIELRVDENVKFVTINTETDHRFSEEFINLIEFTTQFMNSKLVD